MFEKENRANTLSGIIFVALFALAATYIASFQIFSSLAISPLIIGIIIGIFYGNTLRHKLPKEWSAGIIFSTKNILRIGIVLYGFKITFGEIESVGVAGVSISAIVVASTFLLGSIVGIKLLKLDRDTAMLCASGSAVCGAAAVLATEPVIKAESYKAAIAVGTVVVFGTLFMILLPLAYKAGFIPLDSREMGIFIGAITHEVAHVVGASSAISKESADFAVIVKMIRVMMLVPLLIALSWYLARESKQKSILIPWFAIYFILVSGFNSLNLLSQEMVVTINHIDTFLLTMAMTALGMETNLNRFKEVGAKPFILALIMAFWLLFIGFVLVKLLT